MNDSLRFQCTPFSELSREDLYAVLQLRSEVFIVEQNCVYQDVDGKKDFQAWHLLAWKEKTLVGYCRLIPAGVTFPEDTCIGRVVTSLAARRTGVGKILMEKAIQECEKIFPQKKIRISAQAYLEKFYSAFAFRKVRGPYLEDNIPHIEMLRDLLDNRPRMN